jgi:hypothetical protein
MKIAAKRNLVLTTFSSLYWPGGTNQADGQGGLYQPIAWSLIRGIHKRQLLEIGNGLIAVAEHALGLHRTEIAEQASKLLMNGQLPREYHSIGRYYQALCFTRRGDSAASTARLESLVDCPSTPLRYRARALQAVGGNYLYNGNATEAMRFFLEGGRTAARHDCDLLTATLSPWMIAVIRSIDGDHSGALEGLEKLSPFVRMIAPVYPHWYYFYANALAVEWGEAGRLEEAQHACHIALASPYASVNPEWHETAREIEQRARRASRSVIAVNRKLIQSHTEQTTAGEPSLLTDEQPIHSNNKLLLFRKQVGPPYAAPPYSPLEAKQTYATLVQKRSQLIDIINNLDEESLDCLLELSNKFNRAASTRSPREINLEERSTLEQLMTLWVNGDFGPDDFAAVMSALRDCDDDLRRNTIIDRMISYSFYFTRDRMEGEDFWRKRVEARLTPASDEG